MQASYMISNIIVEKAREFDPFWHNKIAPP